jgi:hypothetical protein
LAESAEAIAVVALSALSASGLLESGQQRLYEVIFGLVISFPFMCRQSGGVDVGFTPKNADVMAFTLVTLMELFPERFRIHWESLKESPLIVALALLTKPNSRV